MQTIYIEFTYSAFALSFEDQQLCGTFAAVFPTAPFSDSQEYRRIRITGTEETQYEIFLEGQSVACAMNHREASYHITRIFGDDICSHVNKNIFVMHAATVEIEGKVISLLGASGSGKTTLSLLLANYGHFIGDEYAFVDPQTAVIWHEQHPFQLKSHNRAKIPGLQIGEMLEIERQPFGQAYYASLEAVKYRKIIFGDQKKVKVLIFPHYKTSNIEPQVRKLPPKKLPKAILESVMGKDAPATVFKEFLSMANKAKIHFCEIEFSDGVAAANEIYQYVKSMG